MSKPEGEVDNRLKVMQERMQQMERQLAAAQQGNKLGHVAPSTTAKSAKKEAPDAGRTDGHSHTFGGPAYAEL